MIPAMVTAIFTRRRVQKITRSVWNGHGFQTVVKYGRVIPHKHDLDESCSNECAMAGLALYEEVYAEVTRRLNSP